MRRLLGCALVVAVFASMLFASAAAAKRAPGGFDRSFGNEGMVEVKPPLPPGWSGQFVMAMAAAPDGSSFALLQRSGCEGSTCPSGKFALVRYAPDGSLDTAFDGGAFELSDGLGTPSMVVDSEGRLVIALANRDQVVLRRFSATGQADSSFGTNGSSVIQCSGRLPIAPLAGPGGTLNIVCSQLVEENGKPFGGTVVTIVRLDGNGAPLASFGGSGRMSIGLPGGPSVTGAALAKQGGLYLTASGSTYGIRPSHRYVLRVSAKGRLDGRFAAATERSLKWLGKTVEAANPEVNAVVARPDGKIDVLGDGDAESGFDLRLKPNGRLEGKFAEKAVALLPASVHSAVLGSEGSVLTVGWAAALRILSNGKLAPGFGPNGLAIPVSQVEESAGVVTLARQENRKAMVLDLGTRFCRQGNCPPEPKLVRLFEGSPPKKRR